MNGQVTTGLRRTAHVVLALVAVVGVVLSWDSLYHAATPTFGPRLAVGFPLLADALAAGASLMYVSGARQGRGRHGWRVTAHAAIAATVTLNALAAPSVADVPWHVTAPAVWAVLVELYAREAAGAWKAEHAGTAERIPGRLWLTAPVESARTWLRIARRVEGEQAAARLDVGLHAAAVEALRLALPDGRQALRVRRILVRQLRAGSMPPAAVLAAVGWTGEQVERTPEAVLRSALGGVLTPVGGAAMVTVEAVSGPDPAPGMDATRALTEASTSTFTGARTETLTEPRTDALTPASTGALTEPLTEALTPASTGALTEPRTEASEQARRRAPDTATRVARMAAKHPGMSATEIGRRIGRSPATVRRHLAAGRLTEPDTDTARPAAEPVTA